MNKKNAREEDADHYLGAGEINYTLLATKNCQRGYHARVHFARSELGSA